jgi:hypothetical protein
MYRAFSLFFKRFVHYYSWYVAETPAREKYTFLLRKGGFREIPFLHFGLWKSLERIIIIIKSTMGRAPCRLLTPLLCIAFCSAMPFPAPVVSRIARPCTHTHTHTHTHAYMDVYIDFCIYMYVCMCMCVCVCARARAGTRGNNWIVCMHLAYVCECYYACMHACMYSATPSFAAKDSYLKSDLTLRADMISALLNAPRNKLFTGAARCVHTSPVILKPKSQTQNPKPFIPNPQPQTLNK